MAGVGLKCCGFAPMISESGSAITYGPGKIVGRMVQANIQWMTDDGVLYGDDGIAETDNRIVGMTVDLTVTEMQPDVQVVMLSVEKDGDSYWDTDASGPIGVNGFIRVMKENGLELYRVDIVPKISFRKNNEDMQTKGQSITYGTPSVHGVSVPVYNQATGKGRFRKCTYFSSWADAYNFFLEQTGISGATYALMLSNTAVSVAKNATVTLTPTSAPAGVTASDITWTSDNEAAATVSSAGVVTGVAAGNAVITAEYEGLIARCRVTVTE